MRTAALCLALIFTLTATAAHAGNGNGNANGHDKQNADDGGGNGNGNNGNGNANGGSNSNNGNGSSNGNGEPNGHDKSPDTPTSTPDGLVTAGTDQNTALEAVKSGAALPLDRIEPTVMQQWGGRVIDARLLKIRGTLIYRLTIVSETGVSRRVYYDAKTGTSVPVR